MRRLSERRIDKDTLATLSFTVNGPSNAETRRDTERDMRDRMYMQSTSSPPVMHDRCQFGPTHGTVWVVREMGVTTTLFPRREK